MCASAQTAGGRGGRLQWRWQVGAHRVGAGMSESTESFIKAEVAGHTWKRRSPLPEDAHLLGHTDNWLYALPVGIRPVQLQLEFPRIANDLARLWTQTRGLDIYLEEKEFSSRENRRGFTPLIQEELRAMHLYALRSRSVLYKERESTSLR